MGWSGPKLEARERVLLRLPQLPLWQPALMTIAGMVFLALPGAVRPVAALGTVVPEVIQVAVGVFMLAVAVLIYVKSRHWRILVTDRRLVVRKNRETYEEIPLAEIDAVTRYLLGDGLFVTGRSRKIIVPCKEKTAEHIRAAIAAAKGAARMRAAIEAAKEAPA